MANLQYSANIIPLTDIKQVQVGDVAPTHEGQYIHVQENKLYVAIESASQEKPVAFFKNPYNLAMPGRTMDQRQLHSAVLFRSTPDGLTILLGEEILRRFNLNQTSAQKPINQVEAMAAIAYICG